MSVIYALGESEFRVDKKSLIKWKMDFAVIR